MAKISYSSNHHKYRTLKYYLANQTTTKVKKCFMSDKEFLSIYEMYSSIRTIEDALFVLNLIETSKTFRHYKCKTIRYTGQTNNYTNIYTELDLIKSFLHDRLDLKFAIQPIMEWLFAHTIHTSSLNLVSFK